MERANTNPHINHLVLKRNKNFPNSELPVLIYQKAVGRINKLPIPMNDPVFGDQGFLKSYWK
jgi:uncharacterized protein YjlB